MTRKNHCVALSILLCAITLANCRDQPRPGSVVDEAMKAGLTAKDWPGSDDDYLRAMDRGLDEDAVHKALPFLSKEEAWKSYNRGRNNWVVWTAGNDTLWDYLANNAFGAFDLLKIVSSYPGIRYCGNKNPVYGYGDGGKGGDYGKAKQPGYAKAKQSEYVQDKSLPAPYPPGYMAYDEDDDCKGDDRQFYEVSRQNRWKYLGLVNEPGFQQWDPKGCDWKNDKKTDAEPYGKCGDPNRFGLWLDKRVGTPDPFEDEKKYPGVKVEARGKTIPAGSYYGYASGVVGLRLFPNPAFDEAAKKKWDPVRYYNDGANSDLPFGTEHFERDHSLELGVDSSVHDTHSARAHCPFDQVTVDAVAATEPGRDRFFRFGSTAGRGCAREQLRDHRVAQLARRRVLRDLCALRFGEPVRCPGCEHVGFGTSHELKSRAE